MTKAEIQLNQNRKLIDKKLLAYLKTAGTPACAVLKAMKYAVFSGGKRLRSMLCLESSRACGGSVRSAMRAACAIEFIHNFSLIHDDLPAMDNDSMRRGKPSCHVKCGEGIAILAGDALLNLAFMIVNDMNDKKIASDLIREISRSTGLNGMIGGQGMDIKKIGKKNKAKINDLKTGMLFSSSLVCGAISASAGAVKTKALETFGKRFGAAYQIYDDIKDNVYASGDLERKKKEFKKILNRAKTSLEIFGRRADNLRYIAEKIQSKY